MFTMKSKIIDICFDQCWAVLDFYEKPLVPIPNLVSKLKPSSGLNFTNWNWNWQF
jgi:hypothetical protein